MPETGFRAESGVASAQYKLGTMYQKGEGVPKDVAEAAKRYRKAAEQNNSVAQIGLAFAHYEGNGVPRDDILAYMYINLAAANSGSGGLAAKGRAAWGAKMTPEQIAGAQRLSREWKPTTPAKQPRAKTGRKVVPMTARPLRRNHR